MHSYESFPDDVIDAFTPLVNKYDLEFKVNAMYSVDIKNQHCKINFNMDRYHLQGLFYRKDDYTSFDIMRLVSYSLTDDDKVLERFPKSEYGDKEGIKNQLIHFVFIIDKYLGHVLNGNFDWYERLKEEVEYENGLVELILELEYDHPINKKFQNGDSTWIKDIEAYIDENDIKIKKRGI